MHRRKIIPYNPKLKEYARQLRNNSTYTFPLQGNVIKLSCRQQALTLRGCVKIKKQLIVIQNLPLLSILEAV